LALLVNVLGLLQGASHFLGLWRGWVGAAVDLVGLITVSQVVAAIVLNRGRIFIIHSYIAGIWGH